MSSAAPLHFDFFGERIAVHSRDEALRARIASTLEQHRTANAESPRAEFHLVQSDSDSPLQQGQQFNNGAMLFIGDRHKLATASLGAPPWQIHIECFRQNDEYAYYYVFEPLLLMVLKRCNLVHWHGAAVAAAAGVLLLAGESGSGKSTTAAALLLGGAQFIADDEMFLQLRADGVWLFGADRYVHLTDETAAVLPSLDLAALPLVPRGRARKRRSEWKPVVPPGTATGPVRTVLFPRVEPGADTALRRLTATEALRRLVSQPPKELPAVIRDAPSVERQFDVCTALATGAPCFELTLGREAARVPELLAREIA